MLQASVVFALFAAMAVLTFSYVWYWDNDVRLFTHATQLCGDSPNAYGYLAFVYINQGQTKKAEAIARTLIANPDLCARGWYILGTVRFQEKDYERAREAMQNGFQLSHGKDLLTIMGLAGTDLKLGRNEEAAQIYHDALKRFPNSAYLHANLATALKGMGESDQAARELELQRRLQ